MKTKEFIISLLFIICILITYGLFPSRNNFQLLIIMVTFFVLIPIIFNKIILKKELSDIGIRIGEWKKGLIWSGISLIIVGFVFFIAIYFFDFLTKYPITSSIVNNYKEFIFYEFSRVLPVIFIYDFFFRGFVLLILEKRIAYWGILAQFLLFFALVIGTNSLTWSLFPYLISAPLMGWITYKSRSVFYATACQFLVIIILHANMVRLINMQI